MFQYRKRYGLVATVSSETRSGTGLKIRFGKPPRIFAIFSRFFHPRKSQRYVADAFFTVIMWVGSTCTKSGKPHFQLSFIIAGFGGLCQIC